MPEAISSSTPCVSGLHVAGGLVAVAKEQRFPCKFKSSFREETPFSRLQSHSQDFAKRNLSLMHLHPFSLAWTRAAGVGMDFCGFYNNVQG